MSRQKQRKGRQASAGRVFLDMRGGPLDGARIRVPGFTPTQYAQVCAMARAGRLQSPLLTRFITAFWEATDSFDAGPYSDEYRALFFRWIGAVPCDTWTPLDDLELQRILGGAG
ncbi:hypothetical protein GCM10010330_16130 [Streptomyces tendae]|uniref:hypothetical protein n=1 Tax=Streptomyces tendae TaxID=1932 RepID=UPI00167794D7|nr:hypothetical protein [Streptomyces tendae]GHA64080.1 hypothetical protein GCM10010330_16130 [Streptomyces tendae]